MKKIMDFPLASLTPQDGKKTHLSYRRLRTTTEENKGISKRCDVDVFKL
jgi:hypothetical protein